MSLVIPSEGNYLMKNIRNNIVKQLVFLLYALVLIIASVSSTLADSDQQEAIQQTEDQWKAMRQTLQQSKGKFDKFHKTYQEYKEAAFNIDAEKQIDFVRKTFKLNRNETQKIKEKLIAVRDMFDELDRNGLQAKLEKVSKALKYADGVAGQVDNAWDFAKKFNPENAKDDPTYGLRLIGDLLKEGAGKLEKIPIIGQMMGKMISAYAAAASDYANALMRLDKKIEKVRGGSLCGQRGRKRKQQNAFAVAAQNNEDCQTYLQVKTFRRLRGEAFEGDKSYFLYSTQSERGYFAPVGATTQVYQWHTRLLERRALSADWLANRARSLTAKVESRARQYYRSFSGWGKKSDPGWLLIERLGLVREIDFYGSLPEETFVANYILDKKHHTIIEAIVKKFNEHVLLTGTVYEQNEGEEVPSVGASVEFSIAGQVQGQQTDRHGEYSVLLESAIGASVQTKVTKDNYLSIERSGHIYRHSIVGTKFTLVKADTVAAAVLPSQENELNDLRALRDKIGQLSSVVCNASNTAASKNNFIAENSSAIQNQLTILEKDLHTAFKTLHELNPVGTNIQSSLDQIERLTSYVADASTLAERTRGQTCQASAAMQQSRTDSERDQYYSQVYSGYTEAKATFEKAKLDFRQIGSESARIKENQQPLLQARQLIESKGVIPAELRTAGNEVTIARQEVDVLLDTARESSTQLETAFNSAELLEGQIKQALKPKTGTGFLNTLKGLGRKKSAEEVALKRILKQISVQHKSAKICLKKIEKNQRSAEQESDKLNLHFTKLEKQLSQLRQAFLPGTDDQLQEPLKSIIEQSDLIELLTNMSKGYLNRCMDQLLKTRLCMNDAEQLSSTSFSMQLPNLRGQSCDQAKAALVGYQFQVISAGQATDPDWEYRVAGTDPASGAMISKTDSSILISCYEDLNIPVYLATVDCSMYEGTIAVYLQDQHKAACDCSEGKIWGKSGQRCIDCSRYENGVRKTHLTLVILTQHSNLQRSAQAVLGREVC